MPDYTFCTIITENYLPYANALCDSLTRIDPTFELQVLVSDSTQNNKYINKPENVKIHNLSNFIRTSKIGQEIYTKYNWPETQSELRWSLKPAFVSYLLESGYDKVIFTDGDTFYFSDSKFLFNDLDDHSILLTPHWRGIDPEIDQINFDLQFVGGLFNAGFIGVNKNSIPIMNWWAKACLYKCELDFTKGYYGDQIYLNLMPVYFNNVKILKHQGCNVANWNQAVCKREYVNGKVKINGEWEIVFIHFTNSMIKGILNGSDKLLQSYLDEYLIALEKYGVKLDLKSIISQKMIKRDTVWMLKNWINKKVKKI